MNTIVNRTVLCCLLLFSSRPSLAQDSLEYGMSFELESIRYPACITWGESWANKAFEEEYAAYFDSIATFIKSNPQAKFQIRCHTDFRGTDTNNLRLSQERAEDWLKHLLSREVDSAQISSIGVGELFAREVWVKDSIYFKYNPHDWEAVKVYLDEEYINFFRKDKALYNRLHIMNRRTELTVSDLDRSEQRRVDYQLYLDEFHKDKQVEMIGAGTIQRNDTLYLINKGGLHLHLVALGTENEFTFFQDGKEMYYYQRFEGYDEKLLDISDAEGVFLLDFYGDGGSGKLILVIALTRY